MTIIRLMNKWILAALSLLMASCGVSSGGNAVDLPLAYDMEYTSDSLPVIELPPFDSLPVETYLPDPFLWADGSGRSTDFKDWERHRGEILRRLWHYELGEKPMVSKDSVYASLVKDTLLVEVHERGEILTLKSAVVYPEGEGPFPFVIGVGFPTGSLPQELFLDNGVAAVPFNFTQVMSHTQTRGEEPVNRLYPDNLEIGAYSAWAWGVSRLIDGLEKLGEESRLDLGHIAVTGCSFAGKMALYSGAMDERIALTIAQEPGGGGLNSWRVSETLGNVERIHNTNYAWFLESMRQFSDSNVNRMPVDNHEVAALIAPRALLVLGNTDYEWLADESGYVSANAAREVWKTFGIPERMGYSIQGGHMHCELPESQYADVEAFIKRYLLEVDSIDTDITKAPMFADVDWCKWVPWADSDEPRDSQK